MLTIFQLYKILLCNQGLFSQSLPLRVTTVQERLTPLSTSSLFQKRPLVVTVKGKLMLQHQYPQIKALSHKVAISVKCQNLLMIQV